jgi:hypothetical protein
MSIRTRFRSRQGELFSPPEQLPQVSPEAYQRMVLLLARMISEHRQKDSHANAEAAVGDE